MKQALGWILFAVTAVALYWVWITDAGAMEFQRDQERAMKAENDSLRMVVEARDYREQLLWERADSLARIHDSTINNLPSAQVRYLAAAYALRTAPLDSLWKFMGRWPADTTAP